MRIIMCKGLEGSGRKEWAKAQAKEGNYLVVNKETIRNMLGGYKTNHEKYVLRIRNDLIRSAIKSKRNVIVSDSNLNPMDERGLRQLAKELGVKFQVNDSFLKVSPQKCIMNSETNNAESIWKEYYKWVAPIPSIKLDKDFGKPRCIICNVDAFFINILENKMVDDPFLECVIDALYSYGTEQNGKPYPAIIMVSSRCESDRAEVEEWLNKNLISYDKLYMKGESEFGSDSTVLTQIYQKYIEPKYSVLGVFESHSAIAREWRKLGLRVAQLGYPELNM